MSVRIALFFWLLFLCFSFSSSEDDPVMINFTARVEPNIVLPNGTTVSMVLTLNDLPHWSTAVQRLCIKEYLMSYICRDVRDYTEKLVKSYSFRDLAGSTSSWDMTPPFPPLLRRSENDSDLSSLRVVDSKRKILFIALIGSEERSVKHIFDKMNNDKYHLTAFETGREIQEIDKFDVVLYLGGGIGSHKRFNTMNRFDRFNELVISPLDLMEKMHPSQLFIFTSTAMIAEGSGSSLFREDSSPSYWKFDDFTEGLNRREYVLNHYVCNEASSPVTVGLRIGTLLSPFGEADSFPTEMLRDAYIKGFINVREHQRYRSLLSVNDFVRALRSIITNPYAMLSRFEMFNLQSSFGTVESIAHDISSQTGVHVSLAGDVLSDETRAKGYSLSVAKFSDTFNFHFQDSTSSMVAGLIENVPHSIEVTTSFLSRKSDLYVCPICGSRHLQKLYPEEGGGSESMEGIVRCTQCNHIFRVGNQSQENADKVSSIDNRCDWRLNSHFSNAVLRHANGTVIGKAGSAVEFLQPSKGLTHGTHWRQVLQSSGWNVTSIFDSDVWQLKEATFDIMISSQSLEFQNDPMTYLSRCARKMHAKSKLIIDVTNVQNFDLSTLDLMIQSGRNSIYSMHSIYLAAKLAGLCLAESIPIEEEHCSSQSGFWLLAFQLTDGECELHDDLVEKMHAMVSSGRLTNVYHLRLIHSMRRRQEWIVKQLRFFSRHNYEVVSFGGLNFAKQEGAEPDIRLSHVVDKQGNFRSYQSGIGAVTEIPSAQLHQMVQQRCHKFVVIIEELVFSNALIGLLEDYFSSIISNVVVLGLTPHPMVLKMADMPTSQDPPTNHITKYLAKLPELPFPDPSPSQLRPRRILITHFHNEEFFLPYWIRHHARMFDEAILIDYHSSDRSEDIIRSIAPSTWRVVKTRNKRWEAEGVDREVVWYESQYPHDWKIALCVPEFLISPNFRKTLKNYAEAAKARGHPNFASLVYSVPAVIAFGNDSLPLEWNKPLVEQRSVYGHHDKDRGSEISTVSKKLVEVNPSDSMYHRYVHKGLQEDALQYNLGRHYIALLDGNKADIDCSPWIKDLNDSFIMKFVWSPWPEIRQRKLALEMKRANEDMLILPNEQWVRYTRLMLSNNTIAQARELMLNSLKLFDLDDALHSSPDHDVPVHRIFHESKNPGY